VRGGSSAAQHDHSRAARRERLVQRRAERFAVRRRVAGLQLNRVDLERRGQAGEVGTHQIHATYRVTGVHLVVAQHPVAAVVHQQDRDRQFFLGEHREFPDRWTPPRTGSSSTSARWPVSNLGGRLFRTE
jgi:hypothetical protein